PESVGPAYLETLREGGFNRISSSLSSSGARKLSSPRPRGWSGRTPPPLPELWVAPVLAGMVRRTTAGSRRSISRPRARGDGPFDMKTEDAVDGSPPRRRGWSDDCSYSAATRPSGASLT
ncbi:hypothetical protein ABZT51_50725, partial [Streptomyces sp. NPDC005373]